MWRRWPSALALIALAGCGGGDPAAVGVKPRPTAVKDGPTVAAGTTARPATVARPPRGETLAARLTHAVALRARPTPKARVVAKVRKRTRFHSPSVMAVLRQRGRWLGVTSEHLPNGRIGWVRATQVRLLREQWSIGVDLSERRATLRFKGRPRYAFAVAIGAASTPTPTGTFGITDRLTTGTPTSPYGCCVLALSGRQPDVPQEWPGGDRLAIHGTNAPASVGQAVSRGCLRASAATMRRLLARVPLGARVVIRP